MTPIKIVQFPRPPIPLVHLRPKIFNPLDLGRPNYKRISSLFLQMITNQLKENIIQGLLLYAIMLSAFVFSIKSLILSGFSLTSFHLAEVTKSSFSWLYTLVCAVVQKYQEMFLIYNYSHF